MKFGQKFIRPNKSSNRTTGAAYRTQANVSTGPWPWKLIWKTKLRFTWTTLKDVILTQDNLKKEKELTGEQMLYVPKRLKSQLTFFALPCCSKPMEHVKQ